MGFESFKIAANDKFSAWANGMHKNAANVSEKTLNTMNGALGAITIISVAKVPYDLYNGDFSYISSAGPIIAMGILKTGIDNIQAVKTSEFNTLKNKVQKAVINRAKQQCPDWAHKNNEEILELAQKSSGLPLPLEQHMNHLTSLVKNINPQGRYIDINNVTKYYLRNSSPFDVNKLQIGFRFGTSDADKLQSGFRFGSSGADKLQTGFSFGTSDADKLQSGFSFGPSGADKLQTGFNFGNPDANKPQIGFSFS